MFWTWMSAVRCNLPFSATIICLIQFFLLWPYSFTVYVLGVAVIIVKMALEINTSALPDSILPRLPLLSVPTYSKLETLQSKTSFLKARFQQFSVLTNRTWSFTAWCASTLRITSEGTWPQSACAFAAALRLTSWSKPSQRSSGLTWRCWPRVTPCMRSTAIKVLRRLQVKRVM